MRWSNKGAMNVTALSSPLTKHSARALAVAWAITVLESSSYNQEDTLLIK